ncbi:SIR2 family NAD-dependent protein deacylase [Ferruginibacter sp.]|nr:SIR2 family protein [Ferruginibacter sp.]
MEYKHSIKQTALQLRDQLSSDKRKLGFFFGAGTSMAVGIPGVFALTEKITESLVAPFKSQFEALHTATNSDNIEQILNKLRTVRELIGESTNEEHYTIKGKEAASLLDIEICRVISTIVYKTDITEIIPHMIFSNWLFQNQAARYSPIEIFTTNYDLLIEQALEYKRIPYFDGFVGSINPFLIPECVEAENIKNDQSSYIPYSWIRLWKLHGSINWFLTKDKDDKKRIIRCTNRELTKGDELMIYPSKQKYDESRRLPFLVFQDRLRRFLSNGETLLIIGGYSFGDEHLNEILFQALRANKRLAITALMFGDSVEGNKKRVTDEKVLRFGIDNPNFTVIGPDKGCIGGVITEWNIDEPELDKLLFWDNTDKNLNLGSFSSFADYLKMNFGILAQMQETKKEVTTDEK